MQGAQPIPGWELRSPQMPGVRLKNFKKVFKPFKIPLRPFSHCIQRWQYAPDGKLKSQWLDIEKLKYSHPPQIKSTICIYLQITKLEIYIVFLIARWDMDSTISFLPFSRNTFQWYPAFSTFVNKWLLCILLHTWSYFIQVSFYCLRSKNWQLLLP